ncbi:hypothetical protein QYZ44_27715 [Vibrio parahaemolyticus]|nr:hypothetical protein [Vibrio parahaemolyticus]
MGHQSHRDAARWSVGLFTHARRPSAVADDVFITERTITLYKGVATINSQLQHQYFDGETGCMQEDYE